MGMGILGQSQMKNQAHQIELMVIVVVVAKNDRGYQGLDKSPKVIDSNWK